MGKRELVALLCLSSWCFMIVAWLFLTMPRVCLQFVIVVFPDHTHLLFLPVPFNIMLYRMDHDINESCYKVTILERSWRKMTILWSFSYNSFVKFYGKIILDRVLPNSM